jgi:hypothetical protein
VVTAQNAAGYLLNHQVNDAFTGTTRLLAAGEDVYWLQKELTANGKSYPAGTIYVPAKPSTGAAVAKLAKDLGLTFEGTAAKPQGEALKLRPVRVGLWDRYGGSQDSGHIRWLFEQAFPTPYQLVYAPTLDAGDLKAKYDVLIFPDGALPGGEGGRGGRGGGRAGAVAGAAGTEPGAIANAAGGRGGRGGGRTGAGAADAGAATTPGATDTAAGGRGGRGGGRGGRAGDVPDEYKNQVGAVTAATTGPQLRRFVEEGGTLLAIGSSTGFDRYFGLPVSSALTDTSADGPGGRLPTTKFYIPGSVLEASVDRSLPIAYGLAGKVDVFYSNSPAFRLLPDAEQKGTRPIAWFDGPEPLRSGWAWGQQYLNGAVGAVQASVGKGNVYLFGPEITFRAQPHGTFKFLFNAIYLAGATPVTLQ